MLEIFKIGGPVIYPLLLCSVVVLTVILERLLFWMGVDIHRNQPLLNEVLELWLEGAVTKKRICRSGLRFASRWRNAGAGAYQTSCNTGTGSEELFASCLIR
jgi:biopolymer transport protein ExbB/TolQ